MAPKPSLMDQYRRIKSGYPDAILFFQVGDFYEMFHEDAKTGSRVLELTLTSREKASGNPIPLCGIPIHAAENYIARLIRAGLNVAVCNQVEEAAPGKKGVVKREVVRVVTPGTLTEDHLLSGGQANYLGAACGTRDALGLAYVDISTGDFRLTELTGPDATERLVAELARIECRELIVPEGFAGADGPLANTHGLPVLREGGAFDPVRGEDALKAHLGVSTLSAFGLTAAGPANGAAGAILGFLSDTQKSVLPQITRIRVGLPGTTMLIDRATQTNLEITRRAHDGAREGSLFSLMDRTRTAMGTRKLKDWLTGPLLLADDIGRRADAVAWGVEQPDRREALCALLGRVGDLERLTARVAMGRATPLDLTALRTSLAPLPEVGKLLPEDALLFGQIKKGWDDLADVHRELEATLADEVPRVLKDGGVIRTGVSPELDELRAVGKDVRGTLARMEAAERTRCGIESLKIRHNNVFGYYIEISKAKLAERGVPDDFVRKQTLVNAERFITPELKELETKIFSASERIERLEAGLFAALRDKLATHVERLQWTAAAVASIDTVCALAVVAHEGGWVRPEVTESRELHIEGGRHPSVEAMLPAGAFVANDTQLSGDSPVQIVTGPNMAGKSTYLRQVALICLLAQMGSFVPAARARIGVVDRIFSRIGASDNVSEGLSTFMVEMTETAGILHNATDHSLVILDEIGRGTSTFDGLSIAWAVAEHLHDISGARTLFATHYHELTDLAQTRDGVENVNVQVREWNDEIVFLHKIVSGGADRSYGIQVARLAGLPNTVIERAREVLANLEGEELTREGKPRLAEHHGTPATSADGIQFEMFGADRHPVLEQLKAMDLAHTTPMEALNMLFELQKRL
ncbi:MAG: DNA mismatch repair protein MutS [Leptospirillia bacterium]